MNCHIALAFLTILACIVTTESSKTSFICKLPKDAGHCKGSILRWYYNKDTRKCVHFFYGGCKGNGNNFKSKAACQKTCKKSIINVCHFPKVHGPCRGSFLRWYYNKGTNSCMKFIYGGCKGNKNRFETKAACQKKCKKTTINVCHLPKLPGPCKGSFPRWYYNKKTKTCINFIYGGCGGNANRFKTKTACQNKCKKTIINVCHLPKVPGPCRGSFLRWYYNKGTKRCTKFIYGGCKGNKNRFETKAACQKKCKKTSINVCHLSKLPGPCKGSFPRWYYNKKTKTCIKFIYGGCGGNANRFKTKTACQNKCKKLICKLPKASGLCLAYFPRWYYNKKTNLCTRFIYGGCGGNANRFKTKTACQKTCN